MGLTLEFRVGNQSRIAEAVREIDWDTLNAPDVTQLMTNFSLHITPRDLDLLSEAIGELNSTKICQLGPFLTGLVDEEDRGALSVEPNWVAYIAAADGTNIQAASMRWVEKMKKEYPDEDIQLTKEMIEAASSLLNLCKQANAKGTEVVHVWFL